MSDRIRKPNKQFEKLKGSSDSQLREELDRSESRCAELEHSLTELIEHYSEMWDLPILQRAEAARDGSGHRWLLRKQAEAIEEAYKSTVLTQTIKDPDSDYGKGQDEGLDSAVEQFDLQMKAEVDRLRQQADELERNQ